ncbi:MAG: dihydrofolate reductase family protein [Solirubrobacterales bacterium]
MGLVRVEIAMSLDGYVAGPNQSVDEPLGEGGESLHDWAFALDAWRQAHGREGGETNPSSAVVEESLARTGAHVMGRKMFGGGPGPWDAEEPWNGWWGEEPPFHKPVFVLTHHPREPLELTGTTFTFVSDGIESALSQAREAVGDKDVQISGGAEACNQYLAAGLVDELQINLAPLLLGGGERLFEGVGPDVKLEQTRAVEAPGVTHLFYRVGS